MRKTISLATYQRIKTLFSKHPEKEFTPTQIRDDSVSDYNSTLMVLGILVKEKFLIKKGTKYKLKEAT